MKMFTIYGLSVDNINKSQLQLDVIQQVEKKLGFG
uniref:Uncharacterized protein n=1 Tax=Rhizophora mucronata TaxID=61149 RepID=A0A2P2QXY2_RHIMU